MTNNKKCKRCGGGLILEDGVYRCINCGAELKNPAERGKHYDANKKEILRDLEKIGQKATQKKWGIPSSTIYRLLQKWGARETLQATNGSKPLPSLPEFSGDWSSEVQLKWLEVWENTSAKIGEKQ